MSETFSDDYTGIVDENKIVLTFVQTQSSIEYFLKPFLKGKMLRSSERGVNSILTTILRF